MIYCFTSTSVKAPTKNASYRPRRSYEVKSITSQCLSTFLSLFFLSFSLLLSLSLYFFIYLSICLSTCLTSSLLLFFLWFIWIISPTIKIYISLLLLLTLENYCGPAEFIKNGFVFNASGAMFGDIATYSCYSGYVINGEKMVACTANGTWEAPPSCICKFQ